jgi:biotin carboxyl carrier protein
MLRRFSVKIGETERVVELGLGDDGRARVFVDGVERAVELERVEDGTWLVRVGGEQTLVHADSEGTAGRLGLSIKRPGGDPVVLSAAVTEARSARVAALARQARGAATAGPATVRSPMPGRIVKVLVRAGERIAAGQAVVVVEAMKMENELRAPRAGTVREIRCAEGTAVEAGQDLVVVEGAPSPTPQV